MRRSRRKMSFMVIFAFGLRHGSTLQSADIVVGQINGAWTVAEAFEVARRPTMVGLDPGPLEASAVGETLRVRWDGRDVLTVRDTAYVAGYVRFPDRQSEGYRVRQL
jgi:hypothetical protein